MTSGGHRLDGSGPVDEELLKDAVHRLLKVMGYEGDFVVANAVVVIEVAGIDGSQGLAVLHSNMPAWQQLGLLAAAQRQSEVQLASVYQGGGDVGESPEGGD